MASSKMQAIKLAKLNKVLKEVVPSLREKLQQFQKFTDHDVNHANCVLLNGLLHQRLLDNDFPTAKLVAGKATFGVNKGKYGVIDFGYQLSGELMHLGQAEGASGRFDGHCWIEIKKLGVIVDLTLSRLKEQLIKDNQMRGISDTAYSLPTNKIVIPMAELTTRQKIIDGSLGYMYSSNSKDTEFAKEHFKLILDLYEPGADELPDEPEPATMVFTNNAEGMVAQGQMNSGSLQQLAAGMWQRQKDEWCKGLMVLAQEGVFSDVEIDGLISPFLIEMTDAAQAQREPNHSMPMRRSLMELIQRRGQDASISPRHRDLFQYLDYSMGDYLEGSI